ncbi:MAG: DEAD/DEAH box helicase [Pirellulaceae bacterium]
MKTASIIASAKAALISAVKSRDQIASLYLDSLPYPPYPVQEEALLTYFTAEQGVLVCAPTGTGKTMVAEAALFEALHTRTKAYYTTPLIALTEQKFAEMQSAAARWGFHPDDVGLVTGNRRVNPDAPILVVVAEILLNRLLHKEAFAFDDVSAVVMDEFHNFADVERGIVWELALGMLPPHVRVLLLSATVGNAFEFRQWLQMSHKRSIELVEGRERKVPLHFQWVGDLLLNEQIEKMAEGSEEARYTPALIFCFNRDRCWEVAEQLKGKTLLADGQQGRLSDALAAHDWSKGAGPKLKQILQRGVGVHHAGVLAKYRRIVEDLFQQKLLSVCVCTETLAAGINLPARSVVLPTLLKGKPGEMKVIDPSSAHQIFGRAGRPQFDKEGFIFALAHEDDVKILRWREKFDQIPEDTKDLGLLRAKKDLKRKMPSRRQTEQYWTEANFQKLRTAPPGKLASKGPIPWRLLAYMLDVSPEIEPIRKLVSRRLMEGKGIVNGQRELDQMLLTLWAGGYVTLEPPPPAGQESGAVTRRASEGQPDQPRKKTETERLMEAALRELRAEKAEEAGLPPPSPEPPAPSPATYHPDRAIPTPELAKLLLLRGVNPLYGLYLVNQLGIADREERLQAIESVLEMPGSVAKHVRVPWPQDLPPGPLAVTKLDPKLLQMGLATPQELGAVLSDDEIRAQRDLPPEERIRILTLADKLRRLFDAAYPGVHSLNTVAVRCAGEVLEFGGQFDKYVTARGLQKQEGIIFRHLLRLILLLKELAQLQPLEAPADTVAVDWKTDLLEVADRLIDCCRRVDPLSVDKALAEAESGLL